MKSYEDIFSHKILSLKELDRYLMCAKEKCLCSEVKNRKCGACLAREQIILHHMALAKKICIEFSKTSGIDEKEFMADAIIGLNDAIDDFKVSKTSEGRISKFFHFATNAIKWQIIRGDLFGPIIKIPSSARKKIRKLISKIEEYQTQKESLPISEICEELEMTRPQLIKLLEIIESGYYKNQSESREVTSGLAMDDSVYRQYDKEDWIYKHDLQPALDSLNEYEKTIIVSYYGIETDQKTLKELSMQFNCSYEKVRQDYHKAMGNLKDFFKKDLGN